MAFACIDIGSNTTRLLVADTSDGRLRELMTQRVFTRIGRSMAKGDAIPPEKIAETADVVAKQAQAARTLGTEQIAIVATAAIRRARNGDELAGAVETRVGLPVNVLSGAEEARLSFLGATKTLGAPAEGQIGVVDVGGGSTELAIGTVAGGVSWSESFRIGSGLLTDSYLRSDPPAPVELHRVREHVAGVFEGLRVPRPDKAVAVGGSATSLRRLVGTELDLETLERSVRVLSSTPVDEVAWRFELDPQRVRLLPAGVLIFEELCEKLERSLQVGNGGLREGAILELAAGHAELLDRRTDPVNAGSSNREAAGSRRAQADG